MNFQQEKIGHGLKYYVKTYGCQSNVRDTEEISGILEVLGFKPAGDLLTADLVILNTCAVRENAEKKVFGEIGYLKHIKLKNPKFLFGVCGCMIQEPEVVNKIINDIEHVDFAFGTHNIHMLPEILKQVITSNQQVIHVFKDNAGIVEDIPTTRTSSVKAFINIMYGCNNFCSYCIVPFTRGRTRSRNKLAILGEIKDLMKHGYKEITLLGQNVNDFGIDQPNLEYRF
jgi:tRNA-2-methylthio-N6-dimethylallyladenosine synthase